MTFVDPVDQRTAAFVTSASFSFVSDAAGVNYGQLRAFDESDSQVDFEISSVGGAPGGDQGYETLSVSGPKIMRLEIDGFDTDVIIDVLEFTTPIAVPEPSSSFVCLGLSILVVGFNRMKKRRT